MYLGLSGDSVQAIGVGTEYKPGPLPWVAHRAYGTIVPGLLM